MLTHPRRRGALSGDANQSVQLSIYWTGGKIIAAQFEVSWQRKPQLFFHQPDTYLSISRPIDRRQSHLTFPDFNAFQKSHPISSRRRVHDLEGDRTVPRRLRRSARGTSLWKRRQRLSVIKRIIPGGPRGFKGARISNGRSLEKADLAKGGSGSFSKCAALVVFADTPRSERDVKSVVCRSKSPRVPIELQRDATARGKCRL